MVRLRAPWPLENRIKHITDISAELEVQRTVATLRKEVSELEKSHNFSHE